MGTYNKLLPKVSLLEKKKKKTFLMENIEQKKYSNTDIDTNLNN